MRTTLRAAAAATALVLILTDCQGQTDRTPPPPPRAEILKDVPTVPGSTLRDTTGSQDAERRTWRVQVVLDSVRAFYRDTLPRLGWSLMSEQGDTALYNMYARRGGTTLWVRAEIAPLPPNVRILSGGFTIYTLIASADSASIPVPPATPAGGARP